MTTTTTSDSLRWARRSLLGAAGIGVLVLAGCGSSSGSKSAPAGQAGAAGSTGSGSATTVQARTVSGMASVLTDSSGRTLYMSDQEASGKVLCTNSACTAIWIPLTVPAGQKVTGPAQNSASLATLKRPDGTTQVSLDGGPLYTFSFDHGAGQNGGNGQKDSFGGTNFTWHTATANGATATVPSTPASAPALPGY